MPSEGFMPIKSSFEVSKCRFRLNDISVEMDHNLEESNNKIFFRYRMTIKTMKEGKMVGGYANLSHVVFMTLSLTSKDKVYNFVIQKDIGQPQHCDLIYLMPHKEDEVSGMVHFFLRPIEIQNNLELFCQNKQPDFSIFVKEKDEKKELKIHKFMFEVASPVFAAMISFNGVEATENRIIIEDFSFEVVKTAVDMIYGGEIPINATLSFFEDLYRFMDKYDIKLFIKKIAKWYDNYLNDTNICLVTKFAFENNIKNLYEKCLFRLALKPMKEIGKLDGFAPLDAKISRDILLFCAGNQTDLSSNV